MKFFLFSAVAKGGEVQTPSPPPTFSNAACYNETPFRLHKIRSSSDPTHSDLVSDLRSNSTYYLI